MSIALLGGNGAKPVAEQYLNDLAKGNASAANKLARVKLDDKNFLMTDRVLKGAVHLDSPSVERVIGSSSSDLSDVAVRYKLNGKSYRGIIELDKDDKGWYVSRGLTLQIPYVSSSIRAGYRVEGSDSTITSESSDLIAYPGVYKVTAPNKYYVVKTSAKLTVAADVYDFKGLALTPSQAYLSEVQKQVDAHYADCAAKTSFYDLDTCGIQLSYPANLPTSTSTVAVKVVQSPKVTISTDSLYEFQVDGGSFTAAMTGTTFSGAPGTENLTGKADSFSADIKIDNDKVVVIQLTILPADRT
ncbi:MAG: hypothetical protein ABI067_17115 [Leifsonia sp.]